MPNNNWLFLRFSNPFASTSARLFMLVSAVALTGCATTSKQNNQAALDELLSSIETSQYVYATQADPLGSYLKNRSEGDITVRRNTPNPIDDTTPSQAMAQTALNFLGVKYRWGGNDPNTGFDCSGLVNYVAEQSLGLKLPRQSADIARNSQVIKRSELQEGDLVFFNTLGQRFSHVGIYLGDDKFVHSPRAGSVVRIEDMNVAYWRTRFTGARRLSAADTIEK